MKIEHIAIWVNDLEKMKDFYCTYFQGTANQKYTNSMKGFSSYFISFDSGARLEIMHSENLKSIQPTPQPRLGFIHLALKVASQEAVDKLTKQLQNDGYQIISAPRTTGDGYYESCILDPENNQIEITA